MHIFRLGLAIAALALSVATASAAPACDAAGFVAGAGQAIDQAARAKSPAAFAAAAERYTDLRSISLFALGSYRSNLPKSREAEYVALTRGFIGRFMAEHASKMRAAELKITSCRGEPETLTVNATLDGGGKVIFKLTRTPSGYRIADMNLQSVWLAQRLRSNFVAVIRRGDGDIEALFKYLDA
jgi:ABC-type transporter MlaC component